MAITLQGFQKTFEIQGKFGLTILKGLKIFLVLIHGLLYGITNWPQKHVLALKRHFFRENVKGRSGEQCGYSACTVWL